jgi:hypothetical protein
MNDKIILQTLSHFKKAGYERVSVSELGFNTKLPRQKILLTLPKLNVHTDEIMGELYIYFRANTPKIQAHFLPSPKRTFEALENE